MLRLSWLPWVLTEEDWPTLDKEYEKLARAYLARKRAGEAFDFFHFNVDLAQGPCVIKRLRGCGAGCEYVAITPDGPTFIEGNSFPSHAVPQFAAHYPDGIGILPEFRKFIDI